MEGALHPVPTTVHALIERGAQQHPQVLVALAAEGGATLSYAQLQHNCLCVGAWLRSLGLVPNKDRTGSIIDYVKPDTLFT